MNSHLAAERRCGSCETRLVGGSAFCVRCGWPTATGAVQERYLALDTVRGDWRTAATPGDYGPYPVPLASDERPVTWLAAGPELLLLTTQGEQAALHWLSVTDAGARATPVLAPFRFRSLCALASTALGALVVENEQTFSIARARSGDWTRITNLLPEDAVAVGLAAAEDGRAYVLARQAGRLTLYRGRGLSPLSAVASAADGAPQAQWLDLAVAAGSGRAAFWGSGVRGEIDLASGSIELAPDDRAPELPRGLRQRSTFEPFKGAATASLHGARAVAASGGAGWGLLEAATGAFREAPAELSDVQAVAGVGAGALAAWDDDGPVLLFGADEDAQTLSARRPAWRRGPADSVALAAHGQEILALASFGGEAFAFLFRSDASHVPSLAFELPLAVERRAGASPTPVGAFPPVALGAGVVIALQLEQLMLWRAPWGGRS